MQGGKRGGEGGMLGLPFDVAIAGIFWGNSRNKGLYIRISRDPTCKNQETGVVPHACYFNTPEAEAGGVL